MRNSLLLLRNDAVDLSHKYARRFPRSKAYSFQEVEDRQKGHLDHMKTLQSVSAGNWGSFSKDLETDFTLAIPSKVDNPEEYLKIDVARFYSDSLRRFDRTHSTSVSLSSLAELSMILQSTWPTR